MSALERLKNGSDLERYRAAEELSRDLRPEATAALIAALADAGVGEWPGDYDAPPFLYPVAEAAAESLASRAEQSLPEIMGQARVSDTAAFYVSRMLRHLGQAGVQPLLELCHHASEEVRGQAIYSLRPQYERCADSRLIAQMLQMLVDPSSSVTYYAVGLVKGLPKDLLALAPPGLIEGLIARCRAEPQAGTFSQALDFFAADPRIFDFKVEQAASGYERPCALLQYGDLTALSPTHIDRLCQGRLTVPLIKLLGALGERALTAAPRLLEIAREQPAAVLALLAMPSERNKVVELVPEIYLNNHLVRGQILRDHPDIPALAGAVLPSLAARAQQQDGDAFRALEKFGSLAVAEAPWVVKMASFSSPDYFRDSAVELLGDFGDAARPAFSSFFKFLEYSSTRPAVLRALIKLGRVAAEFEVPLEVLKMEIANPEDLALVDRALAAIR